MAKKCHPDKNRNRQEEAIKEFKKIGEAYKVLSNPKKWAKYDDSLVVNNDYDDNISDEEEVVEVNEDKIVIVDPKDASERDKEPMAEIRVTQDSIKRLTATINNDGSQ